MEKMNINQESESYQRIEKAIRYIELNYQSQPSLDEMAGHVHLSRFHFNRLFKRWAGVTPLQFMQNLTLVHTRKRLAASHSVMEASLDAGLSGPGRLHDLFVSFDAITPGEYKKMGDGLEIRAGFGNTPFGECLLAKTSRGICHLGFSSEKERPNAIMELQAAWPRARIVEDGELVVEIQEIFKAAPADWRHPFHLHLKGTNFQVQVWRALLSIPEGCLVSYQDVARHLGRSSAVRTVANAIAVNPVAYLIPCHRVISKTGAIHGYRWGASRKKAMIGFEAVKHPSP